MKVILREDITDLGVAGQTVDVKDGYGRNFLLPRNLAIPATKGNLASVGEIRRQKDVRDKKRRRDADRVRNRIESLTLTQEMLVGEEDKLFGSVTNQDITALLAKEGVTVDKRAILLDAPIKVLGMYAVPVKIYSDVTANLRLLVVKKTTT